jgi:hypothetical protein
MNDAELCRLMAGAPVDQSVFRAVQPTYTADPTLRGVHDPIKVRFGVEEDVDDVVIVPEVPPVVEPQRQRTVSTGNAIAKRATGIRWQFAVLEDAAKAVATTPAAGQNKWGGSGRHNALFCAALRVSGLIADGWLDKRKTADVLAAAARQAGIEDDEGARTIENGFRQGGLQ